MADLDKQMEGVSKGIKNLVKNLSDVNEGVAENAASIASANKQTFSGFLARSKLRKTLEKADTAELQKKTQQVARAEKANAKAEAAVAEKQKLIEEEVNANKKIADIREKIAILNASKENASTAEQLKIQDQINSQTSAIAAEANAIQQCAKYGQSCQGADLYLTLSPCKECSKLNHQAGFLRVVYSEAYKDDSGLKFLEKAGVQLDLIQEVKA